MHLLVIVMSLVSGLHGFKRRLTLAKSGHVSYAKHIAVVPCMLVKLPYGFSRT